ncbi:hypothetical protein MN116_001516 [Schistosoma mekongi]|uniref:Profilin n=1 Tax=Schistosoma mekongi TaxID=38744 RepID=A0AAE1ZLI0_SCHME|nr:hypothetical protein MN116_001516 [Schistosoma mekongi]
MGDDSWDNQCVIYVANNKCLKDLCMTETNGNHLGTSNPDFRVPSELILQLLSILNGGLDTSILFMGEKYIILRRDSSYLIGRCGKKSLIFHATEKICLVGQTVDDGQNNCTNGNFAISRIRDYYERSGY